MRQAIQNGFTLVELMIVVAIIGILAAIAIPSYQDYTARAQVSEAIQITSSFRSSMAEYYQTRALWPSNLTAVGQTTAGKYTFSTLITTGGGSTGTVIITSTMRNTGVSPQVSNEAFAISSEDGGETWQCGQLGAAAGSTTLEAKYIPSACK